MGGRRARSARGAAAYGRDDRRNSKGASLDDFSHPPRRVHPLLRPVPTPIPRTASDGIGEEWLELATLREMPGPLQTPPSSVGGLLIGRL